MPTGGSPATRLDGLMLLSLLVVAPVLGWCAWSMGRQDQAAISAPARFKISGGSMAPTLLGRSDRARCDACQLFWDVQISASLGQRGQRRCPHCGDSMLLILGSGSDRRQQRRPDVVEIRPRVADASKLRRGDLVAIDWDHQLHVKRIAALPGDMVQLDGLRLIVNGERLEDLILRVVGSDDLPRFLVDRDDCRSKSRWLPAAADPGWTQTSDRQWSIENLDETPWLVYHHQSVYDQDRPSPVWDDCPFNVGLQRKMYGVDRFCLEGEARSKSMVSLEVAFWSGDGNLLASVETSGDQRFRVSCYDALPEENLPVSANRPLAIRVADGSATLSGLAIHRWIEYRLRPGDDRDPYPLRIARGRCFVLGDNVPISVDSRDIGTIPIANIVGLVETRGSGDRDLD